MPDSRYFSDLIAVLEPRVMFDGAGIVVADNIVATDMSDASQDIDSLEKFTSDQQAFLAGGMTETATEPQSVLIYDRGVDGLEDLLSILDSDIHIYALPEGEDALVAIQSILAELGSVDSLHVLSHGEVGQITLNGEVYDEAALQAQFDALTGWGEYLTENADILLYGCDVGADAEGLSFINRLANITGADVAASDDLTGDVAQGGDWDLERQTGDIETISINGAGYYDYTLTTDMSSASTNFFEVLKGANFDPGQDTQATAAVDLTGDANNAMLYLKYDDQGTAGSTADDELYFRIRTDHSDDKSQGYKGYTWFGMDVDNDGDLDAFLMAFGTSQGFSINLYNAGTGASNSPSTTDLDSQNPSAIVTQETVTTNTSGQDLNYASSSSMYFGKVSDIDGGAGNADGDAESDFFLTFKVNADNFFTKVNALEITGSSTNALISTLNSGAGINKDSTIRFVVATAQQDNSLNGDMGGINDGTADLSLTYAQLGMFVEGKLGDPSAMTSQASAPSIAVGNLSFTEGNGATVIDSSATANDPDGDSDWDTNAKLEVQITANSESADVITIHQAGNASTAGFTISGSNLVYHDGAGGSTTIATLADTSGTTNDGIVTGGDKLTINFNSSATNAIVQELTRAITYNNTSNAPSTTARTVTFTATDKGGKSATDTSTISVTAQNDTPSVTVGNLSFTEGDGATVIDTSATASDPDGDADWDTNAKLEVQLTANSESTDVLAITTAGNFSISSGTLSHSGTDIGTIVESSGTANDGTVTGSDKLTINFNSSATNAIVQELTRSITFNNTSENPSTTSRTATFTLTDKNGSSNNDTSTISVARANDLPTSANNTVSTAVNTAKTFSSSDIAFTDVDGDTLDGIKITQLETAGTLEYNNNGTWQDVTLNQVISKADLDASKLRFTPANNASGNGYDTFKFQVSDGTAYSTASYTMTINVTGSAAPSVTVGDLSFTEGDGATVIDTSATASDSDGDADWDTNAKLEVQITANSESTDVISINQTGTASVTGFSIS